ncbi:ABC-2 transporter permease [Alkalihalobacillus sp. FSL R5-0424]
MNQYYAVEKSFWSHILIGLVAATGLMLFSDPRLQRLAGFLPLLLLSTSAFEVLKHEAKSGWNKYVLTLPLKRDRIVQSHYLFFITLITIGLVISVIAFYLAQMFFGSEAPGYIYAVLNIAGIAFTMGFVIYPLTYLMGTEKAEVIAMIGAGAGIGLFFLSALIYDFLPLDEDWLFSLSFMLITLVLFIISYIVSIQVYKRKEF